MYYYNARYYSPQLGRFISRDPIGIAGGINLYSYVANNPLKYTDPTGMVGIYMDFGTAIDTIIFQPIVASYNQLANQVWSWFNNNKGGVEIGVEFTPWVGDAYSAYSAISGMSIITGEQLSPWDRMIEWIAILPLVSWPMIKGGLKVGGEVLQEVKTIIKNWEDFFNNFKYSDKTINQMNNTTDLYHWFPIWIDELAREQGVVNTIIWTRDGLPHYILTVEWSVDINNTVRNGVFEYTEFNGMINHRFFNAN